MLHLKAFPDVELEFMQTRKEKYIDHSCHNPQTAFGSIEDDRMRRDLTINSLYCNISTDEIIDITSNGVNDIRDHTIRPPANHDLTYDDDPLGFTLAFTFAVLRQPIPREVAPQQSLAPFRLAGQIYKLISDVMQFQKINTLIFVH